MGSGVAASPRPYVCGVGGWTCIVASALGLLIQAARAEDSSPELIQPAVCSHVKPVPPELKGICEVTPLAGKRKKVKLNLTATTAVTNVGGYTVETENYNGAYLSPVIEAMPGDTVAAHLENRLKPRPVKDPQTMAHGAAGENPTNLHYFHGGIVTPNNARPPIDASKGNGDNIYVRLKNGTDGAGKPNSFDYNVPIPGEKDGKGELDARVLEGEGWISHPDGLNWYHSHMHGISSDQVMGGLAGLLSVGEDKANVRAKCDKPPNPEKCNKDTADLKKRTVVRYALLQDISLEDISALPEDAAQPKTAQWAPRERDGLAALADCPDDQGLAAPHVAAGKDLRDRGLVARLIGRDIAARIERDAEIFQKPRTRNAAPSSSTSMSGRTCILPCRYRSLAPNSSAGSIGAVAYHLRNSRRNADSRTEPNWAAVQRAEDAGKTMIEVWREYAARAAQPYGRLAREVL